MKVFLTKYSWLLISLSLLPITVNAFYTNCVNGFYACSSTEPSVTLQASTSIQHCTYVNCPTIEVPAGSVLTATNLTFLYARGDNGVFNFAGNVQARLNSLKFYHGYHKSLACINVRGGGSSVNVTNASFYNNTGTTGAFAIPSASNFRCNFCFFQSVFKLSAAAGSAVTANSGAQIWISNFAVLNNTQRSFQCQALNTICTLENGTLTDVNTLAEGGTLAYAAQASTLILKNITCSRVNVNGNGGFITTLLNAKVFVTNCYFSDSFVSGQGGTILVQKNSAVWMNNTIIERSRAASDGGALLFSNGALYMNNSTIRNSVSGGYGGAIELVGLSTASLINCTIDGNVATMGGALVVRDQSNLLIMDSLITKNLRTGLLVMDWNSSNATVDGNTVFSNNFDLYGAGGISVLDAGVINLRGNLQVINNIGGQIGGISQAASGIINWQSPSILIQNNSCPNNPWASGVLLSGSITNCLVMNFTDGVKNIYSQDYFFVATPLIAQYILDNNPYASVCPGCQFRGLPSTLAIVPNDVQDSLDVARNLLIYNVTFNLKVSQPLPDIKVAAIDFFGNVLPVSVTSPVVVVLGAGPTASLNGQIIKAILNKDTNSATFSDIAINNVVPGIYQVNVSYVGGNVKRLPQPRPLPTLTVTYAICDPIKERLVLSEAKCYPAQEMGTSMRLIFGTVGAIGAVSGVLALFLIYRFRDFHLIRANSTIFLGIMAFGCTLTFLSITVQINSYSRSCMASAWLENLGFTLIFGSLWLKTYRISLIFSRGKGKIVAIKDQNLLVSLAITTVLVLAYLISWQIISPSAFAETYVFGSKVFLDPCSVSSFTALSILIRFFVQLAMTYLAYNIRNVPDEYNESKQIGFATYNWMIFGAVILLIKEYTVGDLQLAFAIGASSNILTSSLTLGILIFYKVYLCYIDPEEYRYARRKSVKLSTPFSIPVSTPASIPVSTTMK